MSAFETLYKQTVTVFNRAIDKTTGTVLWYPTVIPGVHLIVDKSSAWVTNGGKETDNVRLHVRYQVTDGNVMVAGKRWYEPKAWRKLEDITDAITFSFGVDGFDFFVEGVFTEFAGPVSDELHERKGFYNYMNKNYDNVFAITSVSKYNLIPHFEITAR